MKSRYDAIVIGAGSVGVPTAYFLSEFGEKVLVIDELSSSGQGQNKAAIGGVRATHSDPAKIQICLQSIDIFSKWEDKTGTNIGWKKGGYCFPVYREAEEKILKSILPIQKKHGLKIDWLDSSMRQKTFNRSVMSNRSECKNSRSLLMKMMVKRTRLLALILRLPFE